jgi:hypothetical protein
MDMDSSTKFCWRRETYKTLGGAFHMDTQTAVAVLYTHSLSPTRSVLDNVSYPSFLHVSIIIYAIAMP